jgi:hypothetical protein
MIHKLMSDINRLSTDFREASGTLREGLVIWHPGGQDKVGF